MLRPVAYIILIIFFLNIFFTTIEGVSSAENLQNEKSPWPMAHHDSMRTGATSIKSSTNHGKILWKFQISPIYKIMGGDGIVIDSRENIYFYAQDHNIYSISKNGTLRWKYFVENTSYFISGPVILGDCVYFLNNPGIPLPFSKTSIPTYIYGVDNSGVLKYKIKINYYGTPIVWKGAIFIGSKNGIYKITNGYASLIVPELKNPDSIAIASNGYMYVTVNNTVYALSNDGIELWKFKLPGIATGNLVIGKDGTIYVYTFEKGLYAISPTGKLKWMSRIEGSIPSIGSDGNLYITKTMNDYIYVCSLSHTTGKILWKIKIIGDESTAPVIDGYDNIYIGTECIPNNTGYLYSISPSGKIIDKIKLNGGVETNPAIGENGTVYVGTTNGILYAISGEGDNSNGSSHEKISNSVWSYYTLGLCAGVITAVTAVYYLKRVRKNHK